MAHRPTEETRAQVQQMALVGTPQADIEMVLGISGKTLRKHYRAELDTAEIKATANVGGSLYKNAMSGNVSAQIFWMKTRAGWKETTVNEHHHNIGAIERKIVGNGGSG